MTTGKRRAVFLDRDGTLMEEVGYCSRSEQVRVFEGVIESLEKLRAAGYLLIIITNQSGLDRGYFTMVDFNAVQAEFVRQIEPATIDAVYFCGDVKPSPRRKPAPGMLLEAAAEWNIDLTASYMVGDKCSDIEAGKAAGATTIKLLTGYGPRNIECDPDVVLSDFVDAADWILRKPE